MFVDSSEDGLRKDICEKCLGSAAEGEVDVDGRLHFGRLPVEKIWLVAPPLDGIERARGQHRRTADDLRFSMVPCFEMMACRITTPCTWAAFAIGG